MLFVPFSRSAAKSAAPAALVKAKRTLRTGTNCNRSAAVPSALDYALRIDGESACQLAVMTQSERDHPYVYAPRRFWIASFFCSALSFLSWK